MPTETRILDGTNPFTVFGQTFTWGGNFIPSVFIEPTNPTDDFILTLDLEDTDWFIEALQLNGYSGNLDVTINDNTTPGNNVTTFNAGVRAITLPGDTGDT